MTIGMAGPALMDLLLIYFEELDVIDSLAWLLFSQALSRFLGAITAGVMTDRYDVSICFYDLGIPGCHG